MFDLLEYLAWKSSPRSLNPRTLWWCVAVVFCFISAGFAHDWPQWRGPNRDGISQETGWLTAWPAEGPKKLWEGSVGIGYSSFSVSGGRLYTMGNIAETDTVFCFDALTGKLTWKHEYPCSSKDPNGYLGTRSTPTVDGDRVYTLSRQGHFFCLEAASGKVKWSKDFQKDLGSEPPTWGFAGSPLIEQEWVLTEGGGKNKTSVIAFNKHTGDVIWQAGTDGAGYASLIPFNLEGQRCFLQLSKDHLICRKMKDGTEMWRTPWATSYGVNAATPIVHGDEFFLSSGYGYGCAVLKATREGAQEVWRNKNMRNHVNSCVLVNASLYGYDEKELRCLDWKTGQVRWSSDAYGKGAVTYADGKLILYGQTGKLGLADATPESFKEICSFQPLTGKDTWANPVLANGIIYVRSMDRMVALDVRKGP